MGFLLQKVRVFTHMIARFRILKTFEKTVGEKIDAAKLD